LLGTEVQFADDLRGEEAKAKAAALKPGEHCCLRTCGFTPKRRAKHAG